MNRFERCLFWLIFSCILSLFTSHASLANRKQIINKGCQDIALEFIGKNVFDSQSQINKFDVVGNEKDYINGEEYSRIACENTFKQIQKQNLLSQWSINSGIYWILFTIGFYTSENRSKTGF